ncbi:hypothetical protein CDAR_619991 [Caerostris darwini]|uniref:Uncharacterized protein n=1 Tax=Caerostris darwini TaxID=1538125 RepID=A0AAV4PBR1_9ARAC|nr:hypothetical protein CDAR_619991 [Caerostris darwini]
MYAAESESWQFFFDVKFYVNVTLLSSSKIILEEYKTLMMMIQVHTSQYARTADIVLNDLIRLVLVLGGFQFLDDQLGKNITWDIGLNTSSSLSRA